MFFWLLTQLPPSPFSLLFTAASSLPKHPKIPHLNPRNKVANTHTFQNVVFSPNWMAIGIGDIMIFMPTKHLKKFLILFYQTMANRWASQKIFQTKKYCYFLHLMSNQIEHIFMDKVIALRVVKQRLPSNQLCLWAILIFYFAFGY